MSITLRDYPEDFHLVPSATSNEERLTIDRPDRPNYHNTTYNLSKASPGTTSG